MPEFWPILTTDYFEYGTSTNRLDKEGAAVEMGDAALGLARSELTSPPHARVFPLHEQATALPLGAGAAFEPPISDLFSEQVSKPPGPELVE